MRKARSGSGRPGCWALAAAKATKSSKPAEAVATTNGCRKRIMPLVPCESVDKSRSFHLPESGIVKRRPVRGPNQRFSNSLRRSGLLSRV